MTVEACKYRMALHFRNTELSKDLFFVVYLVNIYEHLICDKHVKITISHSPSRRTELRRKKIRQVSEYLKHQAGSFRPQEWFQMVHGGRGTVCR